MFRKEKKNSENKLFTVKDMPGFRRGLIQYLKGRDVFCMLDSNGYYNGKKPAVQPFYHSYDLICGMGASKRVKAAAGNALDTLKQFQQENAGKWILGCLGYDLKNEIEALYSCHEDHLGFADLYFFIPETIILLKGNEAEVISDSEDAGSLWEQIMNVRTAEADNALQPVVFKSRVGKEEYLRVVETLRNHIEEGDVYEVSYCQEFYAEEARIDPCQVFQNLAKVSPQPFSAFMRLEDKYMMCASMERYLKKEGRKLISQPIKGTIRRGRDMAEDETLKQALLHDEKERAENVMIVDLVRNDLSRTCKPGTVAVEELFGIYEFPGVYQMISTVTGELKDDKSGIDAIRASFPMGSMTGAPKIMAMDIIERYEKSKRGIYSGAIGYFTPEGDFDLNVVIRTLLYNAADEYLSLHVGSAITYDSVPEKEYEECLVKIASVLKAL